MGEILLVVIGILIALQVNNWNEERINNKKEYDYMIQLKQELEENIDFINGFYLDRYDRKVQALEMVRDFYHGNYLIKDSTNFAIEVGYGAVFATKTFRTSTAVFEEIISTGNLALIKDEKLRRLLIEYYDWSSSLLEALKEYDSGYLIAINSYRPFNNLYSERIDARDATYLIEKVKTDKFYQIATGELTYAHQAIDFMKTIKMDALEIIVIIDELLEAK